MSSKRTTVRSWSVSLVRVAGGRAVVGDRRAERVARRLVEAADRRAHPHRLQVARPPPRPRPPCARRSSCRSGCRRRPGRPRRPRRSTSTSASSGCGSTAIVRFALPMPSSGLRLEDLRGAPPEQVLRDVEVVLDQRDPLAARPLDHERPRLRAATGRRTTTRGGWSAASGRSCRWPGRRGVPSEAYWPGGGADVPGGVGTADARPSAAQPPSPAPQSATAHQREHHDVPGPSLPRGILPGTRRGGRRAAPSHLGCSAPATGT